MILVVLRPHEAKIAQLDEQIFERTLVLVLDVGLEDAVGVTLVTHAFLDEANRQPHADSRIETLGSGIVAEHHLDGLPVFLVQALLVLSILGDEQVVANQIAHGQGRSTRIEGFEYQLGVVLSGQVRRNQEKLLQTGPEILRPKTILLGLLAEEREVVHNAFRNKLGHRRVIQDREERLAVGAGEHEFVLVTHEEQVVAHEIGIDVSDAPEQPCAGLQAFYAGADTLAEKAARAAALAHVDFVCIRFDLADPNGADKSVADCVADAKAVADAIDKPIVVAGCKNAEKDAELFAKVSEALQGRNILVLSAKEENYKGIAAGAGLAYGQKVGAESAVDINLAKQLNVLITQMGLQGQNIAMNIGSAAAGYGFEYVASTLERVKAAALTQNDTTLQMPIITPVGVETWGVKEATAPVADAPEWGDQEERGIDMEVETAAACLAYGSDAVILRHPASIETVSQLLAALL